MYVPVCCRSAVLSWREQEERIDFDEKRNRPRKCPERKKEREKSEEIIKSENENRIEIKTHYQPTRLPQLPEVLFIIFDVLRSVQSKVRTSYQRENEKK